MGRAIAFAAVVALVAPACSGDSHDENDVPHVEALLGGTSMTDTPWPSDAFLKDGHLDVREVPLGGAPASVAALAATLSELDGASIHTSVFFPTSGGLPNGPVTGVARWIDLDDPAAPPLETKLFFREETKELVALPPISA